MSATHLAKNLGINLGSKHEEELFKWFLLCLLFGRPIQREIAERAYRELVRAGRVSPNAIIHARWDRLVQLLDEAHYVRYDFSTATKLLDVCSELKRCYGTMTHLLAQAKTANELRARLLEFKHIGPVTAGIFVREVRPIWYPAAGAGPVNQRAKQSPSQNRADR